MYPQRAIAVQLQDPRLDRLSLAVGTRTRLAMQGLPTGDKTRPHLAFLQLWRRNFTAVHILNSWSTLTRNFFRLQPHCLRLVAVA